MKRLIAASLLALAAACGSSGDSSKAKTDESEQSTTDLPGKTARRPVPRLPVMPRRRGGDGDAGPGERRERPSLGGDPQDREPGDRRMGGMMERFDENGDGQLDDKEREAMMADRKAMMKERMDRMVVEVDSDKDGKISRAEAEAAGGGGDGDDNRRRGPRLTERFDEMDSNGDGYLTPEEMQAAMEARGRRGGGGWRGGPPRGGNGPPGGGDDTP